MGTSLSGLTPATTFDGLLKVGDNDPLTATLKPISTGDGTDTMLELSTSALQVGGTTGMYWDNTNKRLGIGTDAPSTPFEVYGGVRFRNNLNLNGNIFNSASGIVNIDGLAYFNGITDKVGIGETTPTSRLHVKGSGNDNTTTSLLVQNSDASASLTYDDSGKVEIVGNSQTGFIQTYGFGAVGFGNESGPTILYGNNLAGLHTGSGYTAFGANSSSSQRVLIKGSGATSATTSLLVQNSAGTEHLKVTDDGKVNVRSELFVNHPSVSSRYLSLSWGAISATSTNDELSLYGGGGVNGSIMYLNASAKSAAPQAIGMKTTGVLIAPSMVQNSFAPSAQLQVKGSGNDATTTALLVQNSDGTDMLSVKDDLSVVFNSTITSASSTLRFDVGGVGTIRMNSDKVAIGGNTTPTARLHIKGSGATSATTALLVQNSAGTELLKVTDDGAIDFGALGIEFSNDGSGGTMSVASDRYIRLATSLSTYSALNAHVFKTLGSGGYSEVMRITGNSDQRVGIGESAPTARLHIKGSGATSATTALLVQNSAGTDMLRIMDGGADKVLRTSSAQIGSLEFAGANIGRGGGNPITFAGTNQIGIGVSTPVASAKLQVDSTTQGFLPPRMTDAERDAITNPAAGLMIYDTSNNQMNYWNGSTWIAF